MSHGREADAPTASDEKRNGSLREALAAAAAAPPAASPSDPAEPQVPPLPARPSPAHASAASPSSLTKAQVPPPEPLPPSAASRLIRARAGERHIEVDAQLRDPTGQSAHRQPAKVSQESPLDNARTQLIRGKPSRKAVEFHQDPVVGWLVVVGGPGLGAFRPIFEGNNTIGRAKTQRIPIDFGDETISSEEQAYLRYDSVDRVFLLVPNLAKTNIVAVNAKKPTAAVELTAMDLITMGRTQLVFVPFCSNEFDWSELVEMKA